MELVGLVNCERCHVLNRVRRYIAEQRLLAVGDRVVVAVSGGADSVALLDLLANLAELNLSLIVAHLNHNLRAGEAEADAAFVKELAGRYGILTEIGTTDVRKLAEQRRLSLEDAGRAARYSFFAEVVSRFQANRIALGHHADDQAETVLMRLLRGAGTSGLVGMAPQTAGGKYIRPLLGVSRRELEEYLVARGLSWRTDSSNADLQFLRNRIRHELLPQLTTYNPAISARLVATAQIAAADEALLKMITDQAFDRLATLSGALVTMDIAKLRTEADGLRLRLYRRALQQVKGDLARINFRHLLEIDAALISPRPHLSLVLPDGLLIRRSYGELSFSLTAAVVEIDASYEFEVGGAGSYPLPGGGVLQVALRQVPADWAEIPPQQAFFDLERAPFPWCVRTFRPGDRLVPLGMTGRKKVKELFIDEKIPLSTRRRVPLLFANEELIWVCGIRVASGASVTGRSKAVAAVEIAGFTP